MSEIAINYRLAQNEWIPGSCLNFVVEHRFEVSQNDARKSRNASNILVLEHNTGIGGVSGRPSVHPSGPSVSRC